jgi:hypothetical protein
MNNLNSCRFLLEINDRRSSKIASNIIYYKSRRSMSIADLGNLDVKRNQPTSEGFYDKGGNAIVSRSSTL